MALRPSSSRPSTYSRKGSQALADGLRLGGAAPSACSPESLDTASVSLAHRYRDCQEELSQPMSAQRVPRNVVDVGTACTAFRAIPILCITKLLRSRRSDPSWSTTCAPRRDIRRAECACDREFRSPVSRVALGWVARVRSWGECLASSGPGWRRGKGSPSAGSRKARCEVVTGRLQAKGSAGCGGGLRRPRREQEPRVLSATAGGSVASNEVGEDGVDRRRWGRSTSRSVAARRAGRCAAACSRRCRASRRTASRSRSRPLASSPTR